MSESIVLSASEYSKSGDSCYSNPSKDIVLSCHHHVQAQTFEQWCAEPSLFSEQERIDFIWRINEV